MSKTYNHLSLEGKRSANPSFAGDGGCVIKGRLIQR